MTRTDRFFVFSFRSNLRFPVNWSFVKLAASFNTCNYSLSYRTS